MIRHWILITSFLLGHCNKSKFRSESTYLKNAAKLIDANCPAMRTLRELSAKDLGVGTFFPTPGGTKHTPSL